MNNLENENGRIVLPDASEKSVGLIVASDTYENAETALTTVPATHDPKALDAHSKAGHELIPINGKTPVEKGWRRTPPLSLNIAKARLATGSNIGVRLRNTDLVIDVDPRHFAENDQPLARLKVDFSLPEAPFVKTGGGGFHLYLRKPADVLIVNALTEYAGIEFKSLGRQVVAAGSIHPDSGKPYSHDDDPLALTLDLSPINSASCSHLG
jgi:Bifunctional DNA primase/polymerase, N-terminal